MVNRLIFFNLQHKYQIISFAMDSYDLYIVIIFYIEFYKFELVYNITSYSNIIITIIISLEI